MVAKMHYIYYLYLLTFLYGNISAMNTSPLFVIDNENAIPKPTGEINPFVKTSSDELTKLLKESLKRTRTMIFYIEDHLSTEDVSSRDSLGTPFYHLRQGLLEKKIKYFPAVESPYTLLSQMFEQHEFNVFHLQSTSTKLNIFDGRFKYFYVYFQDGTNETRIEALRRHDLIMREVYFVVRQLVSGPVVAFYTGKSNPVQQNSPIFKKIVPEAQTRDYLKFRTNTTLMQLSGMYLLMSGRRWAMDRQPHVVDETWNRKRIQTKLAFSNFVLQFDFDLNDRQWTLEKVTILEAGEEVGNLRTDIRANWGTAYACCEPLIIVNKRDGSLITIPRYQIEPMREWVLRAAEPSDKPTFHATVNCGPYFTEPIVTAMVVVFVLLAILYYGISSLLDCQGNNQYDDPSGKQLFYCDSAFN